MKLILKLLNVSEKIIKVKSDFRFRAASILNNRISFFEARIPD